MCTIAMAAAYALRNNPCFHVHPSATGIRPGYSKIRLWYWTHQILNWNSISGYYLSCYTLTALTSITASKLLPSSWWSCTCMCTFGNTYLIKCLLSGAESWTYRIWVVIISSTFFFIYEFHPKYLVFVLVKHVADWLVL